MQDHDDEPTSTLLAKLREAKEREPKQKPTRTKQTKRPKKMSEQIPIIEVLKTRKRAMSPEDIFDFAGYDADELKDVDEFYSELHSLFSKRKISVDTERTSVAIKARQK